MQRTAVDTNVLVRLLTRDDTAQWRVAARLLTETVFVLTPMVLLETEWVLRSRFRYDVATIHRLFGELLQLDRVEAVDGNALAGALDGYAAGMDFADAMHIAHLPRDLDFLTFDEDLASRAGRIFPETTVVLAR